LVICARVKHDSIFDILAATIFTKGRQIGQEEKIMVNSSKILQPEGTGFPPSQQVCSSDRSVN
jgi:hypothetical protein